MLRQNGLMRPSGQRHCKCGNPASSVENAVAQIPIVQAIAWKRVMALFYRRNKEAVNRCASPSSLVRPLSARLAVPYSRVLSSKLPRITELKSILVIYFVSAMDAVYFIASMEE